jgi:hypothetical protein
MQPETNGQGTHKLGTPPLHQEVSPSWTGGVLEHPDRARHPGHARHLEHVELAVPARPESLQLVRMSAAFVAARAGLGYDEVQDLRLAVDELCSSLLDPRDAPDRRMLLRFGWDDSSIEITCTVAGDDAGTPTTDGPLAGDRAIDGAAGFFDGAPAHLDGSVGGASLAWRCRPHGLARQILSALVDEHMLSSDDGRRSGWLRKQRIGAGH